MGVGVDAIGLYTLDVWLRSTRVSPLAVQLRTAARMGTAKFHLYARPIDSTSPLKLLGSTCTVDVLPWLEHSVTATVVGLSVRHGTNNMTSELYIDYNTLCLQITFPSKHGVCTLQKDFDIFDSLAVVSNRTQVVGCI